jgi:prepilin-type N-terminal cleavage/methylation domain-containing protein
MKDKKGFTLIELLVVISIIAILMAIMMPALSKVKEMAKLTICKTRLKNLGAATLAYTAANNNKLPVSFWQSNPNFTRSTWQSYVMKETDDFNAPRPWSSVIDEYGTDVFGFGQLWQDNYLEDPDVLICSGVKEAEINRESYERRLNNFEEDWVSRLDAFYSYLPLTSKPHRENGEIKYWKNAEKAQQLSGSSALCMDKMRGIDDFYHTKGSGANAQPLIDICYGDGHITTVDNRTFFTDQKIAELKALTGNAIIPTRDLFEFLDTIDKQN